MITYKFQSLNMIAVYLDNKRVGTIQPTARGFQYVPIGQKKGGKIYQSIAQVKTSLEAA